MSDSRIRNFVAKVPGSCKIFYLIEKKLISHLVNSLSCLRTMLGLVLLKVRYNICSGWGSTLFPPLSSLFAKLRMEINDFCMMTS